MTTILNNYPIIRFTTFEAAAELAAINAADDADSTYVVEEHGGRFVVVIRDEDGEFVGCL